MKRVTLLTAILILTIAGAWAQSWTTTGSMSTARYWHTATLLANGQVLAAGGQSTSGALASAEVYNPTTGVWTGTGSLNLARIAAQSALLSTGNVLVIGGCSVANCTAATNTSELYDPSTGKWSSTAAMASQRYFFTATLLLTGKVLVAGGCNQGNCNSITGTAELYDPSTGKWTATGSLNAARDFHAAALMADGRVIVGGGYGSDGRATTISEIYDPSTGKWTTTGSMYATHTELTFTTLLNGTVLAAGGIAGSNLPGKVAEIYDPTKGTWTVTGYLNTARALHTAILLPSGKVLVAGGTTFSRPKYFQLASCELYDPASGTWINTASMAAARTEHTATMLNTGRILAAGGYANGVYVSAAELYTPQ